MHETDLTYIYFNYLKMYLKLMIHKCNLKSNIMPANLEEYARLNSLPSINYTVHRTLSRVVIKSVWRELFRLYQKMSG